jgi:hypothetical protein
VEANQCYCSLLGQIPPNPPYTEEEKEEEEEEEKKREREVSELWALEKMSQEEKKEGDSYGAQWAPVTESKRDRLGQSQIQDLKKKKKPSFLPLLGSS